MEEKRHAKRINVDLELNVSSLFKQDNIKISNISSPIEVTNISRTGIGFESKDVLPIGFYFNAALHLGSAENTLYCVIKIIRCQPTEFDEYEYGCEFVGIAPILNYIFDDFEKSLEK